MLGTNPPTSEIIIAIFIFTIIALEGSDDGDVINVDVRHCVQMDVSVNTSIVEEVHLQVLDKVAWRVSATNLHPAQNQLSYSGTLCYDHPQNSAKVTDLQRCGPWSQRHWQTNMKERYKQTTTTTKKRGKKKGGGRGV